MIRFAHEYGSRPILQTPSAKLIDDQIRQPRLPNCTFPSAPKKGRSQRPNVLLCQQTADEQATGLSRLDEAATAYRTVDLPARSRGETQAADLRARLKTFAEDWERPEASIYDEDPAR